MTTLFAIPGPDGAPVELRPGQGFTVHRVLVQTEADAVETGAAIGEIVDYEVNVPPGALDGFDDDRLAHFLVQRVAVPAVPSGKIETGHGLEVVDGGFVYAASYADAPPTPVPPAVTRTQGRIALINAGKLAALDAAAEGWEQPAKEYWGSTDRFRRDNAILIGKWREQGGTDAELDALFIAADQVPL